MLLVNRLFDNLKILLAVNKEFKDDFDHLCRFSNEELFSEENFIKGKAKIPNHNDYCITALRKKYNLSTAYHDVINSYYRENCEVDHWTGYSDSDLEPFLIKNPLNEEEKIVVMKLAPETSITEIQKNWKSIEQMRDYYYKDNNKSKLPARKNTNRDIEIFELKKEGHKAKEITKIINGKYPNEPISYQEISKLAQRLKDTAKDILKVGT